MARLRNTGETPEHRIEEGRMSCSGAHIQYQSLKSIRETADALHTRGHFLDAQVIEGVQIRQEPRGIDVLTMIGPQDRLPGADIVPCHYCPVADLADSAALRMQQRHHERAGEFADVALLVPGQRG